MASTTPTLTVDDPHAEVGHHGGDGHHDEHMLMGYDGTMKPSRLQHHFVSSEQQFDSAKLGMWLFLATEILLFGALFVAYGIFRVLYPEVFQEASAQLDTMLGAVNTLVLLLSSLSMAWAIRAAQMDNRKLLVQMLVVTIVLASGFLVVKYFEYTDKFAKGIYPGYNFELAEGTPTVSELSGVVALTPQVAIPPSHGGEESAPPDGAPPVVGAAEAPPASATEDKRASPIFENRRAGLFFSIYYVMTGIHALHILIGIIAIGILAWKANKGAYTSVWYTPVENVGLYWHVVDIIWIFVFPLMYLI